MQGVLAHKEKQMSFISKKLGQFTYFDLQLDGPNWRGKRVLDFGGNIGNILREQNSTIDHDKYWCIDVSRDAIESGKQAYPDAHWVFYDRYNFAFNPNGREGLKLPGIGQQFDYVLVYSVFTHTSETEMMELITELEKWLAADGVLAFTFIDPHFNPARNDGTIHQGYYDGTCLKQRLERMKDTDPTVDVQALLERARNARWCILVNEDDLYIESEDLKYYDETQKRSFHTFYTADYMKTIFPDAVVLPPQHDAYTPSEESMLQHCCVIRKASGR